MSDYQWMIDRLCEGDSVALVSVPHAVIRELELARVATRIRVAELEAIIAVLKEALRGTIHLLEHAFIGLDENEIARRNDAVAMARAALAKGQA